LTERPRRVRDVDVYIPDPPGAFGQRWSWFPRGTAFAASHGLSGGDFSGGFDFLSFSFSF
jgi:hypothetical protein